MVRGRTAGPPRGSPPGAVALLAASVGLLATLAGAQPPAEPAAGPTLAFGGDVLYDGPLDYQLRRRPSDAARADALRRVLGDAEEVLAAADLAVVNLETPVSPRYRRRDPAEDLPVFCAPPAFLDSLAASGVDAVTLANNHAYDQGLQGLEDTVRALRERSLAGIGVGRTAPEAARAQVVEVGGARVAVAAWTEAVNHVPSRRGATPLRVARLPDRTLEPALRDARQRADLVVAVVHWVHGEGELRPQPRQRALVQRAVDAGADLVIGHGTHVPGRVERVPAADGRRAWVLYSLGNLRVSMESPRGTLTSRGAGVRDALVARVRTRRAAGGRLEVHGVELERYWIARPIADAPWRPESTLAVVRPVHLAAEIRRLDAAACGELCAYRRDLYAERIRLSRAVTDGRPAEVLRPLRRPPGVRLARREAGGPVVEGPVVAELTVVPAFHRASALERAVDERALRRVVALLARDRRSIAEVLGYASAEERRGGRDLALRRARRAKGLIAVRGPSRSRLVARGRTGAGGAVVRVRRP
ncbi:MAG: CapA family protein [Sandaracinaceae bacterium]